MKKMAYLTVCIKDVPKVSVKSNSISRFYRDPAVMI